MKPLRAILRIARRLAIVFAVGGLIAAAAWVAADGKWETAGRCLAAATLFAFAAWQPDRARLRDALRDAQIAIGRLETKLGDAKGKAASLDRTLTALLKADKVRRTQLTDLRRERDDLLHQQRLWAKHLDRCETAQEIADDDEAKRRADV